MYVEKCILIELNLLGGEGVGGSETRYLGNVLGINLMVV